ncbi:MAG: dTMP kinase [Phycisphaerales bacterium]
MNEARTQTAGLFGGEAPGVAAARSHGDLSWLSRLAGRFVVFEGPDGSGKSTQLKALGALCRREGLKVVEARDPGGTFIGEEIRDLLLKRRDHVPGAAEMAVRCETMLFMASRAQLVDEVIRPARSRGEVVLGDRFVPSTLAYQGAAGGMTREEIEAAARVACGEVRPDAVLVFDVDERTAAHRLNPLLDRMEAKGAAFHKKVREGYLAQAEERPDEFVVIDARGGADEVTGLMLDALKARAATW